MNLYEPKHLADSMRVVRKNTIAIAEDITEAQYDYRPTHDSRSVRETLLHMASMTLFDLHIHEEQKRTSMEGLISGGSSPDFRPTRNARFLKPRSWQCCATGENAGAIGSRSSPKRGQSSS